MNLPIANLQQTQKRNGPESPQPDILGHVAVLNADGTPSKIWRIKHPKCTIGSSQSCTVWLSHESLKPVHGLLVFGRRNVLARSFESPITVDGRDVQELLIDQPTSITIAGLKLLITPRERSLSDVANPQLKPGRPRYSTGLSNISRLRPVPNRNRLNLAPEQDPTPRDSLSSVDLQTALQTVVAPIQLSLADVQVAIAAIHQQPKSESEPHFQAIQSQLSDLRQKIADAANDLRAEWDAALTSRPIESEGSELQTLADELRELKTQIALAVRQRDEDRIASETQLAELTKYVHDLSQQNLSNAAQGASNLDLEATIQATRIEVELSRVSEGIRDLQIHLTADTQIREETVASLQKQGVEFSVWQTQVRNQWAQWQSRLLSLQEQLESLQQAHSPDFTVSPYSHAQEPSLRSEASVASPPVDFSENLEHLVTPQLIQSVSETCQPPLTDDSKNEQLVSTYNEYEHDLAYTLEDVSDLAAEEQPSESSEPEYQNYLLDDHNAATSYGEEANQWEEDNPAESSIELPESPWMAESVLDREFENSQTVAAAPYLQESDELTALDPLNNESHYESNQSVEADEDYSLVVDSPAPLASTTSAISSETGNDEESIEAYMQQLLQRVRGTAGFEDSSSPSVEKPKPVPVTSPQPPETERPPNVFTSVSVAKVTIPSISAPPPIADSSSGTTEPIIQRPKSPENKSDMAALRELANVNARSAIDRSVRKRRGSELTFKAGVAIFGFIAGISLLAINGLRFNFAWTGIIASFAVSAIWGYEALSRFLQIIALPPAKEVDAPKDNPIDPRGTQVSASAKQDPLN